MRPEERASRATAAGGAGAIAILATVGIAVYLVVRLRNTDVALHFYVVAMAVCGSVALADRALRGWWAARSSSIIEGIASAKERAKRGGNASRVLKNPSTSSGRADSRSC